MNYKDKYLEWKNGNFLSKEDYDTLCNMSDEDIKESFSTDLKFGTAGIRGIMGLGTNKMNKYTISKVTQGLANYLNKKYDNPKVVIAYDTRNNSKEFATSTALILNNNKITTYIFDGTASTPELSFAVTYLGCDAGIVITSSHNASIYNGYKVYSRSGGQIVHPEDDEIIEEVNKITDLSNIKEENISNSYYNVLPDEARDEFIKENLKVIKNKNVIDKYSKDVNITYTSLHGTGMNIAPNIFDYLKVNVNYVKEQCDEDSEFTYAKEPNPEYIENYDLAIKYAKGNNSDIIFASDPDSDRLGIMIKTDSGYELLNGNIVGSLLVSYILDNTNNLNNKYIVRSIVTSNMVDKISSKYGVTVKEVLTGCKNIAEERELDRDNYLFGFEESLGYMFNININDKNSFSTMISFIELICYLKSINKNIYEYITELYYEYGFYYEKTSSITYEGIDGQDKIKELMNNFRNMSDYEIIDYSNRVDKLKTDAIKIIISKDEYIFIRPSGTEPKVKIYYIVNSKSRKESIKRVNDLEEYINHVSNY